jgi:hypothetical protein
MRPTVVSEKRESVEERRGQPFLLDRSSISLVQSISLSLSLSWSIIVQFHSCLIFHQSLSWSISLLQLISSISLVWSFFNFSCLIFLQFLLSDLSSISLVWSFFNFSCLIFLQIHLSDLSSISLVWSFINFSCLIFLQIHLYDLSSISLVWSLFNLSLSVREETKWIKKKETQSKECTYQNQNCLSLAVQSTSIRFSHDQSFLSDHLHQPFLSVNQENKKELRKKKFNQKNCEKHTKIHHHQRKGSNSCIQKEELQSKKYSASSSKGIKQKKAEWG